MALATTCPACSTSFKVNPEQLKLRRGLVRCGKCDHVFSGVEYLRYVSDSRTDEELNEDNDGQDRRKQDRRGTGRRLWGNSEPSATDELKTAFFLPDTEMGPAEAADEGPGNESLKMADKPAASDADVEATDESQNEPEDSPDQSGQPASGKRTRRGGARGKRGRGRRKRAAAKAQAEQNAENGETDPAVNAAGISEPAEPDESASGAEPGTEPGAGSGAEPDADRSSEAKADSSQKPGPFSSRSQTRAGSVITSPLTKGARGDFQRAGRDDDWAAAPVWPKIDEHFDEPDIEEPDTRPGPAGTDKTETSPPEQAASRTADSEPDAQAGTPEQTGTKDPRPEAMSLAQATEGPHEEDAIDFFGKTSRPSFDFDLPPRQVLVIAAGLVALLLLQLVIGNRDVLASRFPAIKSGLAAISAPLGLKVQLPMNREEIKIASFDLTAASSREPDASYVMNLLMRNNARYKLRWPAVELTLLDGVGGILVRKVLLPADYLPDESMIESGLAGASEQPIRVALKSSTDAPIGYSVSLFYP